MSYEVWEACNVYDQITVEVELPQSFRREVEEFAARQGKDVCQLVREALYVRINLEMAFDVVRAANGDREKLVRALRTYLIEDCEDASSEEMSEMYLACLNALGSEDGGEREFEQGDASPEK